MVEVKGRFVGLTKNYNTNKVVLEIELCEPYKSNNSITEISNELASTKELAIILKKYRKKRSLTANSYLWELVNKLAERLAINRLTIYREQIKNIGVSRLVEIDEKAVDTLIHSWGLNGIGWIAEKLDKSQHKGFVLVNLYYGSSVYNTKQMSLLIDNIIQDCKAVGIETLPPEEIEKLKSSWEANNGKS